MHIAVLIFQETKISDSIQQALTRVGFKTTHFVFDKVDETLETYDGFVIIGDLYSAEKFSTATIDLLRQQSQKGKPILGIGEGARVLTTGGLVPGVENDKACTSIVRLDEMFYPEALQLSAHYQLNVFTRKLSKADRLRMLSTQILYRFAFPPALLQEMKINGMDVFYYENDMISIASISNKSGNILAMLPHLADASGVDAIFQSMFDYIKQGCVFYPSRLHYYPRSTV